MDFLPTQQKNKYTKRWGFFATVGRGIKGKSGKGEMEGGKSNTFLFLFYSEIMLERGANLGLRQIRRTRGRLGYSGLWVVGGELRINGRKSVKQQK